MSSRLVLRGRRPAIDCTTLPPIESPTRYVSLQIEAADHGLRVISKVGRGIADGRCRRPAQAALIERNDAKAGDHAIDDTLSMALEGKVG